jgi:ABC-2 type transport system ATP-binding protein/lipopolysaccharide transport system ATP-binding protein
MDSQTAISIKGVSKTFKIYHDKPLLLKEKLLKLRSNAYTRFYALKNVNLEIKKGETTALLGRNGCGKSTLLKLIARIMRPDAGEIRVNGRLSSLIELGAGFHPEFSGRENIYINASIFGMSKKEIDAKIDDIIRFSELGEFIENPVRTYSSGMYMRLAFSVAVHVDPEILLIDEILSVGDANFQKKCLEKIESFKHSGVTIVIVTHDMGTVEKICDRAVWMDGGTIVDQGEADRIVNLYLQHMNQRFVENRKREYQLEQAKKAAEHAEEASEHTEPAPSDLKKAEPVAAGEPEEEVRWGSKEVEIIAARILNDRNEITDIVESGKPMTIEIDYKVHKPQKDYIFGMGFYTADQTLIYGNNTEIGRLKLTEIPPTGTVRFRIRHLTLLSGRYKLNVAVVDGYHRALDFIKYYMDFTVISNDKAVGIMSLESEWEVPSSFDGGARSKHEVCQRGT